jgi:hypothetical protein
MPFRSGRLGKWRPRRSPPFMNRGCRSPSRVALRESEGNWSAKLRESMKAKGRAPVTLPLTRSPRRSSMRSHVSFSTDGLRASFRTMELPGDECSPAPPILCLGRVGLRLRNDSAQAVERAVSDSAIVSMACWASPGCRHHVASASAREKCTAPLVPDRWIGDLPACGWLPTPAVWSRRPAGLFTSGRQPSRDGRHDDQMNSSVHPDVCRCGTAG